MLPSLLTTLALVAAPAPPKPATNSLCPTCPMKVSDKDPQVVVRGRAYRVCCKTCGGDLEKAPDKYLEKDGTPRNAAKK